MWTIKRILFAITHPKYLIEIDETSVALDEFYKRKMDFKFEYLYYFKFSNAYSHHVVVLDGVEIWVSNHPYASFGLFAHHEVKPSRYMRHLLMKKLAEDLPDHPAVKKAQVGFFQKLLSLYGLEKVANL